MGREGLRRVRRDGRVVEGARLESAYTPKGYRGFESHSLRGVLFCKEKRVSKLTTKSSYEEVTFGTTTDGLDAGICV